MGRNGDSDFTTWFILLYPCRYDSLKEQIHREEDRIAEEKRKLEKDRVSNQKKEEELMEGARMLQQKSREIEDTYAVNICDFRSFNTLCCFIICI